MALSENFNQSNTRVNFVNFTNLDIALESLVTAIYNVSMNTNFTVNEIFSNTEKHSIIKKETIQEDYQEDNRLHNEEYQVNDNKKLNLNKVKLDTSLIREAIEKAKSEAILRKNNNKTTEVQMPTVSNIATSDKEEDMAIKSEPIRENSIFFVKKIEFSNLFVNLRD